MFPEESVAVPPGYSPDQRVPSPGQSLTEAGDIPLHYHDYNSDHVCSCQDTGAPHYSTQYYCSSQDPGEKVKVMSNDTWIDVLNMKDIMARQSLVEGIPCVAQEMEVTTQANETVSDIGSSDESDTSDLVRNSSEHSLYTECTEHINLTTTDFNSMPTSVNGLLISQDYAQNASSILDAMVEPVDNNNNKGHLYVDDLLTEDLDEMDASSFQDLFPQLTAAASPCHISVDTVLEPSTEDDMWGSGIQETYHELETMTPADLHVPNYSDSHPSCKTNYTAPVIVPQFEMLLDNQKIQDPKVTISNHVRVTSGSYSVYSLDDDQQSSCSDNTDVHDESDEEYHPNGYSYQVPRKKLSRQQSKHNDTMLSSRSRRRTPQLWRFLLNALHNPETNPKLVQWHDKQKGVFRINDTKTLPQIWGDRLGKKCKKQGKRHTMNYEKFSRAIRYYYKSEVMKSIAGRLLYQFGPNAKGWQSEDSSC